MKRTMKQLASDAIMVQNASNLSGVLLSWADYIRIIRMYANDIGNGGTDFINRHPVNVLFADKLRDMASGDYFDAMRECENIAASDLEEYAKEYDTTPPPPVKNTRSVKLYQEIASTFQAWQNCVESMNTEWINNHAGCINDLVKNYFPSGSGIDNGVTFDYDASNMADESRVKRLVFNFGYHQMDSAGGYDKWIDYTLYVYSNLARGYDMRIVGDNSNGNKEYFYDLFGTVLSETIEIDLPKYPRE